jgi:hypothetical protein
MTFKRRQWATDLNGYKLRLLLLYWNKQESLLNHIHKSRTILFLAKTFEDHRWLNSANVTLNRHRHGSSKWTSGINILSNLQKLEHLKYPSCREGKKKHTNYRRMRPSLLPHAPTTAFAARNRSPTAGCGHRRARCPEPRSRVWPPRRARCPEPRGQAWP